MNTITLTLKSAPELFVEAETITPDHFAGKNAQEIADLPVYVGNTVQKIGDYFDIAGTPGKTAADTKIVVKGDLSKVKYIGVKMTAGEILIEGSPDMYTGGWMQGGKITVKGSAGHFTGIAMKGGELVVEGNAGNYLGAAYRGDWRGMQGGKIVVKGNAGSDLGYFMNGGTIVVGGNVDVHVANHAEGGTIIIKGDTKGRVGGQMVEGEIYIFGNNENPMPSFKYLDEVETEVENTKAKFAVYVGDLAERHRKKKGETIYAKIYQKV
jgi:formylmethanofuran dehydrogenase subunit C